MHWDEPAIYRAAYASEQAGCDVILNRRAG